ncbi:MAG TPA: hypothetical protein VFH48_06950 [Chloroflexota bacterium]|nr:hypothetical protein [Chloroflexota bacterium]
MMRRVLRGVSGALVALALMAGSTAMTPASVAGKPNCLATPCPPPENRSAADVDGSARPRDG